MSVVELFKTKAHTDRVWNLSWHPTEEIVASCSGDKTIKIWELGKDSDSLTCKAILDEGHSRTIRAISWSPDGKLLASASFDGTTSIWLKKENEYECVSTLEGHENEVKSVSWSFDGEYLATCSRDKTVWIWKVEEDFEYECSAVLSGHTQDVKIVKWSPVENILLSAGYDDTIKLWQYDEVSDDWMCYHTFIGHTSTVWGLDFHSSGKFFCSTSDDKTIRFWNISGTPAGIIQDTHSRAIYSCSWSPKIDCIATGGGDNKLCLSTINMDTMKKSAELQQKTTTHADAHDNDLNCVLFHHSKDLLVTASDDGFIKLWKVLQ